MKKGIRQVKSTKLGTSDCNAQPHWLGESLVHDSKIVSVDGLPKRQKQRGERGGENLPNPGERKNKHHLQWRYMAIDWCRGKRWCWGCSRHVSNGGRPERGGDP